MQVNEEGVCIIFWQAHAIYVHNVLQVIQREFTQLKGSLHAFVSFNDLERNKQFYYLTAFDQFYSSLVLTSGSVKFP
jgi:hypothetical protein